MAKLGVELGQDEMDAVEGSDTEEEEERVPGKVSVKVKGKSRRKACERPEGSDQKRQAFSKRKRGLILKSYQLYKLTDAKVFVFIVNDKGTSWAYASPGFKRATSQEHLRQLREYANLRGNQRLQTEIMEHPFKQADDGLADERCLRGSEGSEDEAPMKTMKAPAINNAVAKAAAEPPPPPPLSASAAALTSLLAMARGPGSMPAQLQIAAAARLLPSAAAAAVLPPQQLQAAVSRDPPTSQVVCGEDGQLYRIGREVGGASVHRLATAGPTLFSQLHPAMHMRADPPEASNSEPPRPEPPRLHEMSVVSAADHQQDAYAPMDNGGEVYQVVMGEDGQLYRIVRELDEYEDPASEYMDVRILSTG